MLYVLKYTSEECQPGTVLWDDDLDEPRGKGYYYHFAQPGCLPDSDYFGPFETRAEAIDDAGKYHGTVYEIPEWSLCLIFNGDSTGLSEYDEKRVDDWLSDKNNPDITMLYEGSRTEFCSNPEFGLPCATVRFVDFN